MRRLRLGRFVRCVHVSSALLPVFKAEPAVAHLCVVRLAHWQCAYMSRCSRPLPVLTPPSVQAGCECAEMTMLCPGYLFRLLTSQHAFCSQVSTLFACGLCSPCMWLVFVPELNIPCLDGQVQTRPSVLAGRTLCVICLGPFAHPALARPDTSLLAAWQAQPQTLVCCDSLTGQDCISRARFLRQAFVTHIYGHMLWLVVKCHGAHAGCVMSGLLPPPWETH